jgi:cysteinyl-tRNA synthetase
LIYKTEFIEYFISGANDSSRENMVSPFVDVIARYRDLMKTIASVDKDLIMILKKCDELRDDILPTLGVKIEDRGKGMVKRIIIF